MHFSYGLLSLRAYISLTSNKQLENSEDKQIILCKISEAGYILYDSHLLSNQYLTCSMHLT